MTRGAFEKFALRETDDLTGVTGSRLTMLEMSEKGESYEAIATALKLPIGTVKSNLSRIRARILARRLVSEATTC